MPSVPSVIIESEKAPVRGHKETVRLPKRPEHILLLKPRLHGKGKIEENKNADTHHGWYDQYHPQADKQSKEIDRVAEIPEQTSVHKISRMLFINTDAPRISHLQLRCMHKQKRNADHDNTGSLQCRIMQPGDGNKQC